MHEINCTMDRIVDVCLTVAAANTKDDVRRIHASLLPLLNELHAKMAMHCGQVSESEVAEALRGEDN